jgi:hypothetical protein
MAGLPTIWRSANAGASFTSSALPLAVDQCQWAAASDGTLFVAGYDETHALLFRSTDFGQSFSSPVSVGHVPLYSIAVSPAYTQDRTLLAGNTNGEVWRSSDGGVSFQQVDGAFSANVSVAFDPRFATSRTIYAASDALNGGLYRLVLGTAQTWQRLDSGLAAGARLGSLAISASGVLYAGNYQEVRSSVGQGGVVRWLETALGTEVLLAGLSESATLWHIWLSGNRLWAIDSAHGQLMYYVDYLSQPVRLKSPARGTQRVGAPIGGGKIGGISLEWEALPTATGYQWQLDTGNDFAEFPTGFQSSTSGISVKLPGLSPSSVYYWRVRAVAPLDSPWSAVWFFLTAENVLPAPRLGSPVDGAEEVSTTPLLAWSAVDGATGYELEVSPEPDFSTLVLLESLSRRSWQIATPLSYATQYYWRVRVAAPAPSPWSQAWVFTTEDEALGVPTLNSPALGAIQVSTTPLLAWSAVDGATGYELALSAQVDFSAALVLESVPGHSWQSDVTLDKDVVYFWKVRALRASAHGAWSEPSHFFTESPPRPLTTTQVVMLLPLPPPPLPAAPIVPPPVTVFIPQVTTTVVETAAAPPTLLAIAQTPDWTLYILGVSALAIILLVVAVVVVLARRPRLPF